MLQYVINDNPRAGIFAGAESIPIPENCPYCGSILATDGYCEECECYPEEDTDEDFEFKP